MTKKILFILLLVSNFCFGQITISTTYTYTGCANGLTDGIPLVSSITANKLYIVFFWASHVYESPTITSTNSLQWDFIARVGNSSGAIYMYRLMVTSNYGSETVKANYSSGIQDSFGALWEIGNVQIGGNGINAISQVVSDSASSSTTASITISALSQRNAIMAFFSNNLNPFGGSVESGWSEIADGGCSTHTTGYYIMDRINTTDNTPSTTVSSCTWQGIAIALRQSGRRVTLID